MINRKEFNRHIGAKVRQFREEADLSQTQLYQKALLHGDLPAMDGGRKATAAAHRISRIELAMTSAAVADIAILAAALGKDFVDLLPPGYQGKRGKAAGEASEG